MISPSYSSAILTPPLDFIFNLHFYIKVLNSKVKKGTHTEVVLSFLVFSHLLILTKDNQFHWEVSVIPETFYAHTIKYVKTLLYF